MVIVFDRPGLIMAVCPLFVLAMHVIVQEEIQIHTTTDLLDFFLNAIITLIEQFDRTHMAMLLGWVAFQAFLSLLMCS